MFHELDHAYAMKLGNDNVPFLCRTNCVAPSVRPTNVFSKSDKQKKINLMMIARIGMLSTF